MNVVVKQFVHLIEVRINGEAVYQYNHLLSTTHDIPEPPLDAEGGLGTGEW